MKGAEPPLPQLRGLPPPKPPVWGICPRPSFRGASPPKPHTKRGFAHLDPLRGSPPTLDRLVLILNSLALRPENQDSMSSFLQHTIDSSVRAIPSNSTNVKVNVLITITAPKAVNAVERAPVCVILVIDKSGSMEDENKLANAIEAGQVLVDQLEERDKLGIVEFDHSITTHQEITPAKDKERLKRVLAGIRTGGCTNISDALIRAQQMLAGPTAQGTKR
ncbi:MAG: hypothetical protein EZS28_047045, partial [Streblomastix strix]